MSDSVQESDVAKWRELLAKLEARKDLATPQIARRIAKLKSELGDEPGAVETLAEAMRLYPDDLTLVEPYVRHKLRSGDAASTLTLLAPLELDAKPSTAILIARARAELGDVRGAVETLAKAIARHPGNLPLVEFCARLRLKLGDAPGVINLLSPFEDNMDPNQAWTLAQARAQEDDAQAAADTLRRSLKRYPGDVDLAARCATFLLNAGDAKGVIAILAPMMERLSTSTLVVLAQATAETGDVAGGDSIIVRALERIPGDPVLTRHLAKSRLDGGRSREVVAMLSPSEDTAPPEQVMLLARARLFSGDPMGGLATLERAAVRFPENAAFIEGLAAARSTAGDAKGALAMLDQVPEPRGEGWFLARAQMLETLGDLVAFEATVLQGLAVYPADVPLLSQLSKFLSSHGRLDEARVVSATLEDSVVANPDKLDGLVTSYFVFGDAEGAAEFIGRILSKLETKKVGRRTTRALIDLIPATRLFRDDIGIPIIERILARLDARVVLSLRQQVPTAIAHGIVGDYAGLRARVIAMMPKLERVKDVIEAISLAAWTNDLPTIAMLEDQFRNAVSSEQSVVVTSALKNVPSSDVRVFSDSELGAAGFDIGGADVVILFPGLYNVPQVVQQKLVLVPLARGTDVFRLFDMRRDVLLSGIGPGKPGRERSFAALKRLVAERSYRRVICVGTSGGGMPAAIYGDAIGAERVVVFSTGTFFPPDDDPLERRARAFLHKVRTTGLEIGSDNREIWQQPGRHPELHIHYPARNPQDARHALRMQGLPGVTLYPVESAQHGFFMTLSDEELAAAILGTP